jgi:hypothetical protein
MDLEKYIGNEKPLLNRLDRERAALSAYERRGDAGSLDYAEDELKLLDTLKVAREHIAAAEAAIREIDMRADKLLEMEDGINKRSARTEKRIEEWESSFGVRYNELLGRVESDVAALDARNREFLDFVKAQEDAFDARSAELTSKAEAYEASLKQTSEQACHELSDVLASVKKAQKEFETSISGKLEEDKQTIDRIKYMLSTMSEIIKS